MIGRSYTWWRNPYGMDSIVSGRSRFGAANVSVLRLGLTEGRRSPWWVIGPEWHLANEKARAGEWGGFVRIYRYSGQAMSHVEHLYGSQGNSIVEETWVQGRFEGDIHWHNVERVLPQENPGARLAYWRSGPDTCDYRLATKTVTTTYKALEA